jgi:hypothetical protein
VVVSSGSRGQAVGLRPSPAGRLACTPGRETLALGVLGMPIVVVTQRMLLGKRRRLVKRLGRPSQDVAYMVRVLAHAVSGGTNTLNHVGIHLPAGLHGPPVNRLTLLPSAKPLGSRA